MRIRTVMLFLVFTVSSVYGEPWQHVHNNWFQSSETNRLCMLSVTQHTRHAAGTQDHSPYKQDEIELLAQVRSGHDLALEGSFTVSLRISHVRSLGDAIVVWTPVPFTAGAQLFVTTCTDNLVGLPAPLAYALPHVLDDTVDETERTLGETLSAAPISIE